MIVSSSVDIEELDTSGLTNTRVNLYRVQVPLLFLTGPVVSKGTKQRKHGNCSFHLLLLVTFV